jgi:hypothetical protein
MMRVASVIATASIRFMRQARVGEAKNIERAERDLDGLSKGMG